MRLPSTDSTSGLLCLQTTELTAAGLPGIFTLFPFNIIRRKLRIGNFLWNPHQCSAKLAVFQQNLRFPKRKKQKVQLCRTWDKTLFLHNHFPIDLCSERILLRHCAYFSLQLFHGHRLFSSLRCPVIPKEVIIYMEW